MSALTLSQSAIPQYHWTGLNQRHFLECLAQNGVVSLAAKAVDMSLQAAYAYRQRAGGRVFALGWLAAILVSRDRLFDDLMERAFMGQEDEMIRDPDNNRLVRKRIDNRLGMGMLGRLDRMVADADASDVGGEPLLPAARIVAGDFERFLDLVEREGGGAEAGVFLAAGTGTQSDAFHYQLAEKTEGFGDDPEADDDAQPEFDDSPEGLAAGLSVWRDDSDSEWRTDFPPPPGFDAEEHGEYGDQGYERTLTDAETAVQDARHYVETRPFIAAAQGARDAWFAPEAEVKTELKARAAAERAEQKAAERLRRVATALAEKRRLVEATRVPLEQGVVEIKAAAEPYVLLPNEADARGEAAVHIVAPAKPRPIFGIYGNRLPTMEPAW